MEELNQPIAPIVSTTKPNLLLPILVVFLLFLLGSTGFLAYQNIQLQKQLAQLLTVTPEATPTPTVTQATDSQADWKTYQKHGLQFSYPKDWTVSYDGQPDPSGNPGKYTITVGSINITIYGSSMNESFEDLQSLINLPSGPATITSKKEIQVGGQRALYVVQDNGIEGIAVLDLQKNQVFIETNSNNKVIFGQILSTFKFVNQNQTTDTSNWKTYQINNTPYTFKYPYQLLDSGAGDWISFSSPTNKLVVGYRFLGNKSAQTLEQVITSYTEDPHGDNLPMKFQTKTSIVINGIAGYKTETSDNAYYFFKETSTQKVALFMCPLGADKDLQDTCRQIISTLEFVN